VHLRLRARRLPAGHGEGAERARARACKNRANATRPFFGATPANLPNPLLTRPPILPPRAPEIPPQLLCALGGATLQWAALVCAAALACAAVVQNVYRPLAAAAAGRQPFPLLGAIAAQFAALALCIKLSFFAA
jgi:hypothetical protein